MLAETDQTTLVMLCPRLVVSSGRRGQHRSKRTRTSLTGASAELFQRTGQPTSINLGEPCPIRPRGVSPRSLRGVPFGICLMGSRRLGQNPFAGLGVVFLLEVAVPVDHSLGNGGLEIRVRSGVGASVDPMAQGDPGLQGVWTLRGKPTSRCVRRRVRTKRLFLCGERSLPSIRRRFRAEFDAAGLRCRLPCRGRIWQDNEGTRRLRTSCALPKFDQTPPSLSKIGPIRADVGRCWPAFGQLRQFWGCPMLEFDQHFATSRLPGQLIDNSCPSV